MENTPQYINNLALFNHLWDYPTRKSNTKDKTALTSTEKAVAVCIANHRNSATLACFPGYGRVAKQTGFNRTTVLRAAKRLEDVGIVYRHRVYEDGWLQRQEYYFHFDAEVARSLRDDEDSILNKADKLEGIDNFLEFVDNRIPF
jgi:DNA-binding MarR family transcriptional regulator